MLNIASSQEASFKFYCWTILLSRKKSSAGLSGMWNLLLTEIKNRYFLPGKTSFSNIAFRKV